jgi:hypothetical protein
MAFDENNYEMPVEGEEDLPEESNNNRTFMIAVGILGGLILVSIACLGVVYLFSSRSATAAQQAQAAGATQTAIAANAFINEALTATFEASMLPTATLSPTPTATPPVSVPSPTNTALPTSPTLITPAGVSAGTQSAATATVAAALTQAVAAQKTVVVATPAMPKTGIADEYGLPGRVVMALAFVIVILFARRLRFAPTR